MTPTEKLKDALNASSLNYGELKSLLLAAIRAIEATKAEKVRNEIYNVNAYNDLIAAFRAWDKVVEDVVGK
jgi:hypothetical protein